MKILKGKQNNRIILLDRQIERNEIMQMKENELEILSQNSLIVKEQRKSKQKRSFLVGYNHSF